MHARSALRTFALAALLVLVPVLAAGCGGSDSTTGGSTSSTGSTSSEKATGTDVAAAKEFVAPLVGQPSPFPVTEKLAELPKPGTNVAFLDLGTPVTALMWELLQPAAKTMGINLFRVQASGVGAISQAMDTIVEKEPDGLIFLAADPTAFSHQLEELREQGTIVVAGSIENGEEFGFETVQFGKPQAIEEGELMAAWTVAQTNGKAHKIVYYNVPELPFSVVVKEGVESKLAELCPECELRVSDIPLAEVGKNASGRVVSDLQANPDTEFALFPNDEMQLGLPAALETAGIEIERFGSGPTPGNLEAVQKGEEKAVLAVDVPTLVWTMVDQFARELAGQKLTGLEKEGDIVKQFLTARDLEGTNPELGWAGYPDFPVRFAKLWGVTGQ
ncbi:MAG TPA: substrate-binding domain-containing protein [Solirubrobacterales bacterium]|jgi:ribose transport system substrate-binding protein